MSSEHEDKGIFEQALEMIKTNKANRDAGKYNSIPFGMESLDKHLPGVMRGLQYIITASSGIGKTQLTKFLFVNQPYKFIKQHPELGMKLKILYFALEESKEEFILGLISNKLKEDYGIGVGMMQLRGMNNYSLTDDIVAKIEACREYFAELERNIDIIDSVSNPFGIYNYVRSYSNKNGKHVYRDHTFTYETDGKITTEVKKVYDHYVPNDPNEFVVVITDHISLLQTEKGESTSTLHGAMGHFSSEYCRKNISKHYKYCVVNVQQQAANQEKQQYTHSGQSIESKLEPSLEGLGDNKLTQRDALIVLGLFAPERYQIEKHLGYDIRILRDHYRSLTVLKNRIGTPNLKLPLLFNGQTNTFSELPKVGSTQLESIYSVVRKYNEKVA